jgi:hypothetical protein
MLTLTRTLADVDRDLGVINAELLAIANDLDGIPRALRGSRKWLDRCSHRSHLLRKRVELCDERREMVAVN